MYVITQSGFLAAHAQSHLFIHRDGLGRDKRFVPAQSSRGDTISRRPELRHTLFGGISTPQSRPLRRASDHSGIQLERFAVFNHIYILNAEALAGANNRSGIGRMKNILQHQRKVARTVIEDVFKSRQTRFAQVTAQISIQTSVDSLRRFQQTAPRPQPSVPGAP